MARLLAAAAAAALAQGAAPIPGFRPPAVPLITQSPLMNSWSITDNLYDSEPVHWRTDFGHNMAAMVRVDSQPYMLMGAPGSVTSHETQVPSAKQTAVTVYATQTVYSFLAGDVALNLTFTSPLLTSDWDLFSRPVHYVTFDVRPTDGKVHHVQTYLDISAKLVLHDEAADVTWSRHTLQGPSLRTDAAAVRVGAANQQLLADTDDRLGWGFAYLMADTKTSKLALEYSDVTRNTFAASGGLPAEDHPSAAVPLVDNSTGVKRSIVGAAAVNFGGVTAAGSSQFLAVAVDEVLALDWFGEKCPPYWRRSLPVGDATVVPMDMLVQGFVEYHAVRSACNSFDKDTAAMLSQVGGDEYSTVAQLTYRQVFGAMQLVWIPSKSDVWSFLKEISSCGCLNTADVVYPAFPQILYYSPEMMKKMVVSHLEYAMNFTNQPYPLTWAPHHLGYWPIADLKYTDQENMPLEETAWNLLIIAAIAQRQGGNLAWLAPYWPAIESWYDFLVTLLPFPGEQLSTDDFDGVLYNATNLAVKGVASIAAYGYIVERYTGDTAKAQQAYATAAKYAQTMVEYAWLDDGDNSHFMIGYKGSLGDGGDPNSWPMLYNALWLRLLGYDNLLPDQDRLLKTQRDWYAAKQMQEFGLPLNSRKSYTKDDWMVFLAATYYDESATPKPSDFSQKLFKGLFNWANQTTARKPIDDWTNTTSPEAMGFTARPVYGAMYAPVLVAEAAGVIHGATARVAFGSVHAAAKAAREVPVWA